MKTLDLNYTLDLYETYRSFYPTAAEDVATPNAHRPFSRIEHMIGHKISYGKFKKTEITSIIYNQPQ